MKKIFLDTNVILDYYLDREGFSDAIYSVLESLLEFAEVSSVDSHIVKSSVSLRAKDFEDAMQYFSAKEIGADCIVTRNVKDFDFAEMEVLTPHEFLEKIKK